MTLFGVRQLLKSGKKLTDHIFTLGKARSEILIADKTITKLSDATDATFLQLASVDT